MTNTHESQAREVFDGYWESGDEDVLRIGCKEACRRTWLAAWTAALSSRPVDHCPETIALMKEQQATAFRALGRSVKFIVGDEVTGAEEREKLDLYREWFDVVQCINPGYLQEKDYRLAKELYELLGRRVPHSIVEKIDIGRPPDAGAPVDQWRPIETAPKDGTSVLAWPCWRPPHDVCQVSWRQSKRGGWEHANSIVHLSPILWMPLPAAPTAARADGGV